MLRLHRWIVFSTSRSGCSIAVMYAVLLSGLRSQELIDGSGSVPTELYDAVDVITVNASDRAALAHDASHHRPVVFVGDGGHVSGPHLRARPLRPLAVGVGGGGGGGELAWRDAWDRRHHHNATRVHHIEAECQDEYMKIRIGFNGSFHGLLYSSGYADDRDCVYINGTGRDYYEFYIQLNRCGTLGKNSHHEESRKIPTKNFMWNTVTVQYNPLIEEEWDEHFKVTCEYGYDFWKTVTFPFLDVEVATGNPVVFTLSPPECYMEIRYGYGTTGNRVSGPVRVGDPLTLIIYMRTKYDGFDIVVNDCFAHNGGNKRIQLIDQYGCPVDEKLISRFRGAWSETGVFETQVFAYMKTFRFTGSPALYIECDVRMCHGRCPSQPCHWRNTKSVSKRAVAENPAAQSENINLFQSLRVLQDDEISENSPSNGTVSDHNKVCLRTGAFTTLLGVGCMFLGLLSLSVVLLCHRVRRLNKERDVLLDKSLPSFEHKTFVTHKGRIN